MDGMTPFITAAINAVLEVVQTLKNTPKDILVKKHSKGFGGDVSLEADLVCEDIYVKHLLKFGNVYSEERGVFESNVSPSHTITLDPLDGSDNFTAGIPYYGTSISLQNEHHEVIAALVANYCSSAMIFKDEAYHNGQVCRFSKNHTVEPYCENACVSKVGIFEASCRNPELSEEIYKQGFKLRSPGALALSLALARSCSFVLYCGRLRMFDIEAGIFISNDLNVYHDDCALLIAREDEVFDTIKSIVSQYHKRS